MTIDASTVNSIADSAVDFGFPFGGQRLKELITVEATASANLCMVVRGTRVSCVAMTAFQGTEYTQKKSRCAGSKNKSAMDLARVCNLNHCSHSEWQLLRRFL